MLAAAVIAGCAPAAPSPPTTPDPTPPAPTATATASPPTATPPAASDAPLVEGPLPDEVTAELQAIIEAYAGARDNVPSVSAAVIVPGEGIWSGVTGLADPDAELATTPDTIYGIGSLTKTYVAALTLLLVGDGLLGLDEPAEQWLDGPAADKANDATVRQLLGHHSGVANYTENDEILEAGRAWTPLETLELAGPPHFSAGARFEYSNTNYILLGLVVERAGGAPLEEQLRSRLYEPYGLDRTFLSGRDAVVPPLARPYTDILGGPIRDLYDGSGHIPNEALATGAWAAGGMASSASDVARWLYQLASGRVLGDELTAEMLPAPTAEAYGLGVNQLRLPGVGHVVGHFGDIPGYVALGFQHRESGNVVAVATNTNVMDLIEPLAEMFGAVGPAD